MTGRWLWMLTSCSTSVGTDLVWMPAGPARCCSSTTCGLSNAGRIMPRMCRRGVLSSLSVSLPFQGVTIGALNIYAGQPKFSMTVILSWPKRLLPGSLSQSVMQKQQPGQAMISLSSAS